MLRKMLAGSTSQDIPLFISDTSSTTGAGLGSIVFNTSGLTAKYRRKGDSAWTSISLITKTLGTWASGGFVADGAGISGGYELGVPNAAIAGGVEWVEILLYGVTNMLPVLIFIELDAVNYQSSTAFVASVPTVVGSVGSVSGGIGGGLAGNVSGNVLGSVAGAVGSVAGNVGGNVSGSVASVLALANNSLTAAALASDAVAEIANGILDLTDGIETSITLRQAQRLFMAVLAGKLADTAGSAVFKRKDGTTTGLTVTHDNAGNRTIITIGDLT